MKLSVSTAFALHLSTATTLALPTVSWTVGQVVNTTTGRFSGHPSYNRTDVSAYLGIPYAMPPVGPLRFKPPQNIESPNDDVVAAQHYGFNCPQVRVAKPQFAGESVDGPEIINHHVVTEKDSEDCLTLNVWTKPQIGEAKKAILIFIYGGAFSSGRSNNPATNGQFFAGGEDVIMVTFNYRVGVFGFLGLPGHEQNVGLLDQRAAVEWVRDNAEAFGGDPARITLVGQSAGAASVDLYSYAWTKDPIVNAFIEESGSATSFGAPLPNSVKFYHQLVQGLGCGHRSKSKVMTCLMGKSWEKIIAATPPGQIISAFAPTVDNKTVFADYPERLARGDFIQRPYLLGNNNNEEAYFNATAGGTLSESAGRQVNTMFFNCPTSANVRGRAHHISTIYRYRYFGDFPNLRLYNNSGAYHTSELSVIFGTSEKFSGSENTLLQDLWSIKMRGLWAGFAKDAEAVQALGLRLYSPNSTTLNILARGEETHISYEVDSAFDHGCAQLANSKRSLGFT